MYWLKKHKVLCIILSCITILLLIAILVIKTLIFPNSGKSLYGNRLDGISDVRINDDRKNIIKQRLLDNDNIDKVDLYLKGRIINILINVTKDVDYINAKSYADNILSEFSNEEKKYYDFQFYISCNECDELYPIIGYKHKTSVNFIWTNNS